MEFTVTYTNKKLLQRLNSVSPGFCAAKWYNSTIWLSNGRTSSCHHPPAHSVDKDAIANNPSALHNTEFKKSVRAEMLAGGRPSECGYCWKVEDSSANAISDRVYKSAIYSENQIAHIADLDPNEDINPTTLEISFDNICNYQCTYCNSEFSTTWNADIYRNGGYNLRTPQGQTFNNPYTFDSNIIKEKTPYVDAFIEWYNNSLKNDLTELRVTGGEPTMSPSFWEFIDSIDNPTFNMAVNSNLGMKPDVLNRLIECSKKFPVFDLYTSAESSPDISEFVRGGFKWDTWYSNLTGFIEHGNYRSINVMMTISILSLPGLVGYLDKHVKLKQTYPNTNITLSANILRFPSFQSVNNLPAHLKEKYSSDLKQWLNINNENIYDFEYQHLVRVCEYLDTVETSYEDQDSFADKHSDLKSFINEYSKRQRIDVSNIYDREFISWLETLNV